MTLFGLCAFTACKWFCIQECFKYHICAQVTVGTMVYKLTIRNCVDNPVYVNYALNLSGVSLYFVLSLLLLL